MKCSISLLLSLICTLVCNQAVAGKVYKWTDNKGVVHFSEHPPLNTPTEVVKHPSPDNIPIDYGVPSSTASSSAPATAVTVSSAAKSSVAAKAPSLKDPARCEIARRNQESLKTFTHIKVKGDNGEYHFLTPEEQQQRLKEANLAAEQSCE